MAVKLPPNANDPMSNTNWLKKLGIDGNLYKPSREGGGNGAFIVPDKYNGQVQAVHIVDKDGNVLDKGNYRHDYGKDKGGGIWDFSNQGGSYGTDTQVRVSLDNGESVYYGGGGGRAEGGQLKEGEVSSGGSFGGGGSGGGVLPNGTVNPSFVDLSAIQAPFVDYGSAFDFAQGIGKQNKDTYLSNLTDPKAKEAALGFVQTDVEGIKNATDQLAPYIRDQGNQDTSTNIGRANTIDSFNMSRTPGFNEFNRGEVAANNEFNRGEREKSIESSGIDYRDRISKVLNSLQTQATGKLDDPTLDNIWSSVTKNRGADIGAATGVSGRSPAGRNVTDMMDINQRIQLALNSQQNLVSAATTAQGVLQPPEERNPTIFAQPTNVPLNTSNVADKIPVTSNISAGAAQQNIGTAATNYEIIPAVHALDTRLATDEYNATGQYNRDTFVATGTQTQMSMADAAHQTDINQGKLDDLNAQQNSNTLAAQNAQAWANIGGAVLSGAASVPAITGAITDAFGGSDNGGMLNTANQNPQGGYTGSAPVDSGGTDFSGNPMSSPSSDYLGGGDSGLDYGGGGATSGPQITLAPPDSSGGYLGGSDGASFEPSADVGSIFKSISTPAPDIRTDASLLRTSSDAAANWTKLDQSQQMQASAQMGAGALSGQQIISPQVAGGIRAAAQSISTLANPNATGPQRAAAVTSIAAAASGPGGVAGNTNSAVQAYAILTNPNAKPEDKAAALAAIGIRGAQANSILNAAPGNAAIAALQVFQTAKNWGEMSNVQRAVSVMQTGHAVYSAISAANAGSGVIMNFGAGAPALGPAAIVPAAIYSGYQQFTGIQAVAKGNKLDTQQKIALTNTITWPVVVYDYAKNLFGDGDKWKTESRNLQRLKDKGIFIPQNLLESMPTKGRSKDELVRKDLPDDFIGTDADGNWVNNKFANDRDVKNLRATDVVNYSAFADEYPDWYERPLDERMQIADNYLKAGAVKEGKGSIKLDHDKYNSRDEESIKNILKDPNMRMEFA